MGCFICYSVSSGWFFTIFFFFFFFFFFFAAMARGTVAVEARASRCVKCLGQGGCQLTMAGNGRGWMREDQKMERLGSGVGGKKIGPKHRRSTDKLPRCRKQPTRTGALPTLSPAIAFLLAADVAEGFTKATLHPELGGCSRGDLHARDVADNGAQLAKHLVSRDVSELLCDGTLKASVAPVSGQLVLDSLPNMKE